MTGLQTEKFRQSLYDLINEAHLPINLVYYIIKDLFNNIENLYKESLEKEKETCNNKFSVVLGENNTEVEEE